MESDSQREPGQGEEQLGISRRVFLRNSGAAAAAFAFGGLLSACSDDAVVGSSTSAVGSVTTSTMGQTTTTGGPIRGGLLRVALGDSAPNDTLDPHAGTHTSDLARARQLFENLVRVSPEGQVVPELAVSMEPNADATVWHVELQPDVTFHDGKPLTSDDVLYSLRRVLDPDNALPGRDAIQMIDGSASSVQGELALDLVLTTPNADLPLFLTEWQQSIVQDGATDFSNPVGTGPFKHVSFTPGDRSLMERYEDYWRSGEPYLDQLEIIGINEPTARFNALQGGQVDVIASPAFAEAKELESDSAFQLLRAESSACFPIYMKTQEEPFSDNRVRQAFRLAADRQRIIDSALLGFGSLGNDIQGKGFPDYYNEALPQREYDPERARALLQEAGYEDLEVTLSVAAYVPGQVEGATAYAETARAAGINITVDNLPPDQYSAIYGQPIMGGSYSPGPFPTMAALFLTSDAALNIETQWQRPEWDALFVEAQSTVDATDRKAKYDELQEILWNEGGYIIWGFLDLIDAASNQVQGLHGHVVRNLGEFDFKQAYLA